MPKARVLIADDHALVAEALKGLLSVKYDVVGLSPNGRRLLVDAAILRPDVIVLDIGMPELNGIDAAIQLCKLLPAVRACFCNTSNICGLRSVPVRLDTWQSNQQQKSCSSRLSEL